MHVVFHVLWTVYNKTSWNSFMYVVCNIMILNLYHYMFTLAFKSQGNRWKDIRLNWPIRWVKLSGNLSIILTPGKRHLNSVFSEASRLTSIFKITLFYIHNIQPPKLVELKYTGHWIIKSFFNILLAKQSLNILSNSMVRIIVNVFGIRTNSLISP